MKNIAVIFTGGTISCVEAGGYLTPDKNVGSALLQKYAALYKNECAFGGHTPFTVLSENLTGGDIVKIFECVNAAIQGGADGVIVAHGTDTLQYTASALGYALGLNCPPVVLVSSNYPLSDKRANGYKNMEAAVDFILQKGGKGVFVSYCNGGEEGVSIHRATRVLPYAPYSDKLFSVGGVYGYVKYGLFIKNPRYGERADGALPADINALGAAPNVLMLPCAPDMYYPENIKGLRAAVLCAYHSGTADTVSGGVKSFAAALKKAGVPLYLACSYGEVAYSSVKAFDALGIRVLPKASPVAMYIKLRLGLNPFIPLSGDILSDLT